MRESQCRHGCVLTDSVVEIGTAPHRVEDGNGDPWQSNNPKKEGEHFSFSQKQRERRSQADRFRGSPVDVREIEEDRRK